MLQKNMIESNIKFSLTLFKYSFRIIGANKKLFGLNVSIVKNSLQNSWVLTIK